MKEELKYDPIEEVEAILNFMNTASKPYLQALGITNRVETIIEARKVIGKHSHLKNVQNKTNSLINKVKGFKAKFFELFKNEIP